MCCLSLTIVTRMYMCMCERAKNSFINSSLFPSYMCVYPCLLLPINAVYLFHVPLVHVCISMPIVAYKCCLSVPYSRPSPPATTSRPARLQKKTKTFHPVRRKSFPWTSIYHLRSSHYQKGEMTLRQQELRATAMVTLQQPNERLPPDCSKL